MNEATRKKVLYVVLGLAVIWGAWNFSHPRKRYQPSADPVTAETATAANSSTTKAPTVDIEAKRAEAWGRDPFRSGASPLPKATPAVSRQSKEVSTSPGWSLTGILYSAASPMAFINGRMVKVGDMIDRAMVVAIEKQKVTLRLDGRVFDLFVHKG